MIIFLSVFFSLIFVKNQIIKLI